MILVDECSVCVDNITLGHDSESDYGETDGASP
jgi:hypothetical protein